MSINKTLAVAALIALPFLATSCAKCDSCAEYRFSTHTCDYLVGKLDLCDECERDMDDAAAAALLLLLL